MSTECISNESLTVVCVFSIITRRKSWFNGKNLVKLKKISWFHNITLNVNKEFLRVPSRADFFVYEIRRHTLSNVFLLHVTVVKKIYRSITTYLYRYVTWIHEFEQHVLIVYYRYVAFALRLPRIDSISFVFTIFDWIRK